MDQKYAKLFGYKIAKKCAEEWKSSIRDCPQERIEKNS